MANEGKIFTIIGTAVKLGILPQEMKKVEIYGINSLTERKNINE